METKQESLREKVLREISYLVPGYGVIKLIKDLRKESDNNDGIKKTIYRITTLTLSNGLAISYLATSLGSGNWTPHQYREQTKLENIAFGENGLADYNSNGHVERWEKLKFFDENGLENSIDSILLNGSFRVNSREIEQAVNNYKSLQNENEMIEDGKYGNK